LSIAIKGGKRLMKKLIIGLLITAAVLMAAAAAVGQEASKTITVTKTVQNADGTYTIIEYPVGKEVGVMLNPVTLKEAHGTATILRDPSGTRIKLNLTGMPADATAINVYAVDPTGATTLLGPVQIANGVGTLMATTPLDKFMIIASPDASLTSYGPDTAVMFRSAVPEGYAVVPFTSHPVGEKVSATTTSDEVAGTPYTVPMLNIPAYKKGDDTKLKIDFSGELAGARANVFIEPHRNRTTDVRFRFHELKDAPAGKVYTVWGVSPDNQYFKIGQVVNLHGKNEAEVKAEVPFKDFGLLVTMENLGDVTTPIGPRVGWVEIIRTN